MNRIAKIAYLHGLTPLGDGRFRVVVRVFPDARPMGRCQSEENAPLDILFEGELTAENICAEVVAALEAKDREAATLKAASDIAESLAGQIIQRRDDGTWGAA